MASSLTIATFNCRGITRAAKQAEVIHLARSRKIDILLLQETFVSKLQQIKNFDRTFGTKSYWNYGGAHCRGVAVILMPRFTGSVLRYARDSDGHVLSVDLDSGVRIVNVHAPAQYGQHKDFFNSLYSYLVGPSRVILAGDFNCVLEQADRVCLRGTPKFRDRNCDLELWELVNELRLVDAWRSLRPPPPVRNDLNGEGNPVEDRSLLCLALALS